MHHSIRRLAGFTLYELLMTLGLVAVIVTLGLPSFGSILAGSRLRAEANALFEAVHLARKESIVRRRAVTLCPSLDGQNCDPLNDWSVGWMRFVNTDRDDPPVRDPDEPVLHYHIVQPGTLIDSNRRGFTLRSTELRATNGTLVVCDPAERAAARAVVVSYTGRPRVARQDSRGQAYRCAH
ncbi:MAG: GspH/FimT family pseudopilin [Gammaproteobacteria bacterium]|nr:GspH/FimT family pseudopilin [Gammaproteobacteria bacterium]MDH4316133.1 GspH/FimT family pseudopilin [Gammaproteobacteria bacterium]MDH5214944.1 GspH/FimT family pseudopilin [Gammaproteobacteria bacterium]MDH5501940.1 GspH/FimT family pseudopilin [Gammaproteobacteria bacterium]